MKRILIVDDLITDKTREIIKVIERVEDCTYDVVNSTKDVFSKLSNNFYDILILDLCIPETYVDNPDERGAVKLLRGLNEKADVLNLPVHVIGITSHDNAYEACYPYFQANGWPLIKFSLEGDFEKRFESLLKTKLIYSGESGIDVDVVIITALRHTELEAVLDLPFNWIENTSNDDVLKYYRGSYKDKNGSEKNVLAIACGRMGSVASAVITTRVIEKFNPSLVLMLGIAAGIKGKAEIGDILVADSCWDWGNGKRTVEKGRPKFLSAPHHIQLKPKFRIEFQDIAVKRTFLDEIFDKWKGDLPKCRLNLKVGPIASGSAVLEDESIVGAILEQHREIVGIEMEGYGVALSSVMTSSEPDWLVMKSVCDFADLNKNNSAQKYASFTSAQMGMKFLTDLY